MTICALHGRKQALTGSVKHKCSSSNAFTARWNETIIYPCREYHLEYIWKNGYKTNVCKWHTQKQVILLLFSFRPKPLQRKWLEKAALRHKLIKSMALFTLKVSCILWDFSVDFRNLNHSLILRMSSELLIKW